MKQIFNPFVFLLMILLLSSCASNMVEKRRYRAGFHFRGGESILASKSKKSKEVKFEKLANDSSLTVTTDLAENLILMNSIGLEDVDQINKAGSRIGGVSKDHIAEESPHVQSKRILLNSSGPRNNNITNRESESKKVNKIENKNEENSMEEQRAWWKILLGILIKIVIVAVAAAILAFLVYLFYQGAFIVIYSFFEEGIVQAVLAAFFAMAATGPAATLGLGLLFALIDKLFSLYIIK